MRREGLGSLYMCQRVSTIVTMMKRTKGEIVQGRALMACTQQLCKIVNVVDEANAPPFLAAFMFNLVTTTDQALAKYQVRVISLNLLRNPKKS